jgi:hypothetical protein
MSTPANHPLKPRSRRDYGELADLLEDFTLGVMLFAGAAIVVTILVLMVIL